MGSDNAGDPDSSETQQTQALSSPTTGETRSFTTFPTTQSLHLDTSQTIDAALHRDSGDSQSLHTTSHDMATSRKASIQQQRTARWQADASNHPSSEDNPTSHHHSPDRSPSSTGATERERNGTEFEPREGTYFFENTRHHLNSKLTIHTRITTLTRHTNIRRYRRSRRQRHLNRTPPRQERPSSDYQKCVRDGS